MYVPLHPGVWGKGYINIREGEGVYLGAYISYMARVPSNLVPRVYSAFKMAAGHGEDPGTRWRNTPQIVEYFVT